VVLPEAFRQLACMPNTHPVNDRREVTEFILGRAREANLCRVYPIGAITVGQKGGMCFSDFAELREPGGRRVDDGRPVKSRELECGNAHGAGKSFGLAVISTARL